MSWQSWLFGIIALAAWIFPNPLPGVWRKLSPRFEELPKRLQAFLDKIVHFLWNPISTALYVLASLTLINVIEQDDRVLSLSAVVAFVYLATRRVKEVRLKAKRIVSDSFDDDLKDRWTIITGQPDIDFTYGNPRGPSLRLNHEGGCTDSFLTLIGTERFRDFRLTCDVNIKPGALINIVFRHDSSAHAGYMARLDTRPSNFDSFLKKLNRCSWEPLITTRSSTDPEAWHTIELEVRGEHFKLSRNNELVAECTDGSFASGYIGVFNEVGEAHVDNLVIERFVGKSVY